MDEVCRYTIIFFSDFLHSNCNTKSVHRHVQKNKPHREYRNGQYIPTATRPVVITTNEILGHCKGYERVCKNLTLGMDAAKQQLQTDT